MNKKLTKNIELKKRFGEKLHAHRGMSMCESHTGLGGWEGGVSYTDLVGVGLGGGGRG